MGTLYGERAEAKICNVHYLRMVGYTLAHAQIPTTADMALTVHDVLASLL
jgi:hypothetical protein